MPGYLQIQSCVIIKTSADLTAALDSFRGILCDLGFEKFPLEQWLSRFTWEDLQNFGFGEAFNWMTIDIGGTQVQIAPNICGFSQTVDKHINSEWVELNILLNTNDLSASDRDWRYKVDIGNALWSLACRFAAVFNRYGAYLTDELGNAQPWYALMGSQGDLWEFDLAVIPQHLCNQFSNTPESHETYVFEQGVGIAWRKAWLTVPWA